ncbi:hypothetical protein [Bacillus sp. P14.5]|uniref:hypothetical protein n=1 Tax=Bacillus sp. P14.5 TaxID=1983400 RepID=UPI000DEA2FCC|nr:hypothetical protein [Bacillus sp. P14.5]
MSDLEILRILLVNTKNIREEQTYRAHMYGILMTLLLSKEIYKNNNEIQSFLENNNISFKPYVFLSRTQIVGRVCRLVESFTLDQLKQVNISINKIAFDDNYSSNQGTKKAKKDGNYFDSLLDQFERKNS